MWAQILQNKYLQSKSLAQFTARPNDSPFWKGLMRTKDMLFRRAKFFVVNGMTTRLRGYAVRGDTSSSTVPSLYNIIQRKEDYVATLLQEVPLNIQFRRFLVGEHWNSWLHLVHKLMEV